MNPEKFKNFLYTIILYPQILFIFIEDIIKSIWHWFDGKKTVLGGIFFVVSDYILEPMMNHYSFSSDWDFWLKTTASILIIMGVTHRGIKNSHDKKHKSKL